MKAAEQQNSGLYSTDRAEVWDDTVHLLSTTATDTLQFQCAQQWSKCVHVHTQQRSQKTQTHECGRDFVKDQRDVECGADLSQSLGRPGMRRV